MGNTGPLGTLWAGIGLCCFYIALIWVNTVALPFLTVPLFVIPLTWLMDKIGIGRPRDANAAPTTRVQHYEDAR